MIMNQRKSYMALFINIIPFIRFGCSILIDMIHLYILQKIAKISKYTSMISVLFGQSRKIVTEMTLTKSKMFESEVK